MPGCATGSVSPSASKPPLRSAVVPGFRPSEQGLPFANRFASAPAIRLQLGPLGEIGIGNVADGLCGGMCLVVREAVESGRPAIEATEADILPSNPPAPGTRLHRRLVRAQVRSLRSFRAPLRLYALQTIRPERHDPFWCRIGWHSRTEETVREWHRIRNAIDAGHLPLVGIARVVSPNPLDLVRHHQVLAWGYEVEHDRLRLRVYDPNHPGRDDVELRLRLGIDGRGPATMLQTTGEPVEAFCLLD